jgi:medium-chain acyl-[acyl-carrier-protein] hydrolase
MQDYSNIKTIESTEVDFNKNYRAYSLMCATQEIANDHACSLQFGYKDLIQFDCVWVLSRMKVIFISHPKWEQKVKLSTWHKGINGIFSLRDFDIRSIEDNSPMVLSTSSWLILNVKNRKMQRVDHILGESALSSASINNAIAQPCQKLISPQNSTYIRSKEVFYSDVDFNLHTNNAKYVEWALDCIDTDMLLNKEIEEYQINFNHESKLHDIIDLFLSLPSDNYYFIDGKIGECNIFQMTIKLKP